MKSYFSRKQCCHLRESIKRYSTTHLTNDRIEGEFQECQQFYRELSMINQFSGQPLVMHPPNLCFSDLIYPLAIHLTQSNHFWKNIRTFCLDHQILVEFIKELYDFLVTNISSNVE